MSVSCHGDTGLKLQGYRVAHEDDLLDPADFEITRRVSPGKRRRDGSQDSLVPVMRKAAGGASIRPSALFRLQRAARSMGSSLPVVLREALERALGVDLSEVRLHTGIASQEAADAVGALAYTVASDIHFARGGFDPKSAAGIRLIAHEVAHTVQDTSGLGAGHVSQAGQRLEREADSFADAFSRQHDQLGDTQLPQARPRTLRPLRTRPRRDVVQRKGASAIRTDPEALRAALTGATRRSAPAILDELGAFYAESPTAFVQLIGELDASDPEILDRWLRRLQPEIYPLERMLVAEPTRLATLFAVFAARTPQAASRFIRDRLSKGLLDWSVSDREAVLAYIFIKARPASEREQFRDDDFYRWFTRMEENLPQEFVLAPQRGQLAPFGVYETDDTRAQALAAESSANPELSQALQAIDELLSRAGRRRAQRAFALIGQHSDGELQLLVRRLDARGHIERLFRRLAYEFIWSEARDYVDGPSRRMHTLRILAARDHGYNSRHVYELLKRGMGNLLVDSAEAYLAVRIVQTLPESEREEFAQEYPKLWGNMRGEMTIAQRESREAHTFHAPELIDAILVKLDDPLLWQPSGEHELMQLDNLLHMVTLGGQHYAANRLAIAHNAFANPRLQTVVSDLAFVRDIADYVGEVLPRKRWYQEWTQKAGRVIEFVDMLFNLHGTKDGQVSMELDELQDILGGSLFGIRFENTGRRQAARGLDDSVNRADLHVQSIGGQLALAIHCDHAAVASLNFVDSFVVRSGRLDLHNVDILILVDHGKPEAHGEGSRQRLKFTVGSGTLENLEYINTDEIVRVKSITVNDVLFEANELPPADRQPSEFEVETIAGGLGAKLFPRLLKEMVSPSGPDSAYRDGPSMHFAVGDVEMEGYTTSGQTSIDHMSLQGFDLRLAQLPSEYVRAQLALLAHDDAARARLEVTLTELHQREAAYLQIYERDRAAGQESPELLALREEIYGGVVLSIASGTVQGVVIPGSAGPHGDVYVEDLAVALQSGSISHFSPINRDLDGPLVMKSLGESWIYRLFLEPGPGAKVVDASVGSLRVVDLVLPGETEVGAAASFAAESNRYHLLTKTATRSGLGQLDDEGRDELYRLEGRRALEVVFLDGRRSSFGACCDELASLVADDSDSKLARRRRDLVQALSATLYARKLEIRGAHFHATGHLESDGQGLRWRTDPRDPETQRGLLASFDSLEIADVGIGALQRSAGVSATGVTVHNGNDSVSPAGDLSVGLELTADTLHFGQWGVLLEEGGRWGFDDGVSLRSMSVRVDFEVSADDATATVVKFGDIIAASAQGRGYYYTSATGGEYRTYDDIEISGLHVCNAEADGGSTMRIGGQDIRFGADILTASAFNAMAKLRADYILVDFVGGRVACRFGGVDITELEQRVDGDADSEPIPLGLTGLHGMSGEVVIGGTDGGVEADIVLTDIELADIDFEAENSVSLKLDTGIARGVRISALAGTLEDGAKGVLLRDISFESCEVGRTTLSAGPAKLTVSAGVLDGISLTGKITESALEVAASLDSGTGEIEQVDFDKLGKLRNIKVTVSDLRTQLSDAGLEMWFASMDTQAQRESIGKVAGLNDTTIPELKDMSAYISGASAQDFYYRYFVDSDSGKIVGVGSIGQGRLGELSLVSPKLQLHVDGGVAHSIVISTYANPDGVLHVDELSFERAEVHGLEVDHGEGRISLPKGTVVGGRLRGSVVEDKFIGDMRAESFAGLLEEISTQDLVLEGTALEVLDIGAVLDEDGSEVWVADISLRGSELSAAGGVYAESELRLHGISATMGEQSVVEVDAGEGYLELSAGTKAVSLQQFAIQLVDMLGDGGFLLDIALQEGKGIGGLAGDFLEEMGRRLRDGIDFGELVPIPGMPMTPTARDDSHEVDRAVRDEAERLRRIDAVAAWMGSIEFSGALDISGGIGASGLSSENSAWELSVLREPSGALSFRLPTRYGDFGASFRVENGQVISELNEDIKETTFYKYFGVGIVTGLLDTLEGSLTSQLSGLEGIARDKLRALFAQEGASMGLESFRANCDAQLSVSTRPTLRDIAMWLRNIELSGLSASGSTGDVALEHLRVIGSGAVEPGTHSVDGDARSLINFTGFRAATPKKSE